MCIQGGGCLRERLKGCSRDNGVGTAFLLRLARGELIPKILEFS